MSFRSLLSLSPTRRAPTPVLPRLPVKASLPNHSTPATPSPLRDELTDSMAAVKLGENADKLPTTVKITTGPTVLDRAAAGLATPPPSDTRIAPLADEFKIKSKSLTSLLPSKDDDVFAPSTISSGTATPPETIIAAVQPSHMIADRIRSDLVQHADLGYNGFNPRADRDRTPNAANAQGLFPPDALVFVANLSGQRTEEQLEISCHQAFDIYGTCHIKVKRDKNNHPFALLQFETVEAAREAIQNAHGLVIDGRHIRLETAKAERSVIISRQSGGLISEVEARGLLEKYGAIEALYPTSAIRGRSQYLPHGVFVKFAFYLDCRDALRAFHNNAGDYHLQLTTSADLQGRFRHNNSPAFRGPFTPRSRTDLKSVFVGNMPADVTKQDVMATFEEFGSIVDANIIHKVYDGNSINTFGFVEFSSPEEAEKAASAERYLGANKLRVEPKEYSARRPHRRFLYPTTPTHRTPRRFNHNIHHLGTPMVQSGHHYHNIPGSGNMFMPATPQTHLHYAPYDNVGFHHGVYDTPPPRFEHSLLPNDLFSPSPAHIQYQYPASPYQYYPSPYNNQMGQIPETNEGYQHFGGY